MAAGSTIGTLFKVTTWGESHGKAIGVVADGCPAGLALCEADIQALLDRRKPGQSRFTTQRSEGDQVEILSGVFEGKTTGTPISMIVWNRDQRSRDYSEIAGCYRPGHADYTFDEKFGFRDYRGGGRSSARETIGRVAAGAIAEKFLKALNISVCAYTRSIGPVEISSGPLAPGAEALKTAEENPLYMPDPEAAERAARYLEERMADQDSAGGVVECVVSGLPAGLGEPVFEKLDANLARAILSIGAVKGVEIGDGFAAARSSGSENNDGYRMAAKLGHTVLPPRPSLIPLVIEGEECPQMQGLSLRNVSVRVKNQRGKAVFQEQGELLFTHFGLSGPLVLSASAHMRDFDRDRYTCSIDLKPALDEQTLDARLVREFSEHANQAFHNVLEHLAPRLLVPVLRAGQWVCWRIFAFWQALP